MPRVVRTIFLLSPRSGWAWKEALLSQKCAPLIIKYGTSLDYRAREWVWLLSSENLWQPPEQGSTSAFSYDGLEGSVAVSLPGLLELTAGLTVVFPRLIVLRAFSLPSVGVEGRSGFHRNHDFFGSVHDPIRNSGHILDLVYLLEQ